MKLSLCVALLILVLFDCSAFEITPESVQPGDTLTIEGSSEPGTAVPVTMSFETSLPVSGGRYEYLAQDIEVPQKPNTFSVEARDVIDLNLGVKMGIWVTRKYDAEGGFARVSQSDVPEGRYNVKIFGTASEGATEVRVKVLARTSVETAGDGSYSLTVDTSGVPEGIYRIESQGQTEEVSIGRGERSSAARPSGEGGSEGSGSSGGQAYPARVSRQKVPITPEVARWYAPQIDLDPDDPEQLAEARHRLEMLTKDGSWIVIARGAELAEQYGTCQDIYCLDRGAVCRSCKDKDWLVRARSAQESAAGDSVPAAGPDINRSTNVSRAAEASPAASGCLICGWSQLFDKILRLFGLR